MPNPNLGNQFANARVPDSLYSYGQPTEAANNISDTTYSSPSPVLNSFRASPSTFTEASVEPSTDIRMSHAKHMLEM